MLGMTETVAGCCFIGPRSTCGCEVIPYLHFSEKMAIIVDVHYGIEDMRKLFVYIYMTVSMVLVGTFRAEAQEVAYSLPKTVIKLDVTAEREVFFAGPYAKYAKKYLGIDARESDRTEVKVLSVAISPAVEADLTARYKVAAADALDKVLALSAQGLVSMGGDEPLAPVEWRFKAAPQADFTGMALTSGIDTETKTLYKNVTTDTSFTRVAVSQDVVVEKSLEKKASEAANVILSAREERFKITIGDTDATYSGEALGAAIAELTRIEKEYLTMFIGYSQKETFSRTFDVVPEKADGTRMYVAFRVSDEEGLTDADSFSGRPYYLEVAPESVPAAALGEPVKASSKLVSINYRIPAVCKVSLTDGKDPLVSTRVPVYQMGAAATMPVKLK